MSINEHVGLWGSIASLVGLVLAFIQIFANKRRIGAIERELSADAEATSEAAASSTAHASGNVANISVGSGSGKDYHNIRSCPKLPRGKDQVQVSIVPATGVVSHVICDKLNQNFSCSAELNQGKDCVVIHPRVIRSQRNVLEARKH